MLTTNDLKAIKDIVKGEVHVEMQPIKEQLGVVESKVGLLDKKVDLLDKNINKKIDQSQEETIEILSELIHTGYNLHEERIKKIEDQLKTSHVQ